MADCWQTIDVADSTERIKTLSQGLVLVDDLDSVCVVDLDISATVDMPALTPGLVIQVQCAGRIHEV